jgi:hypothetical protein
MKFEIRFKKIPADSDPPVQNRVFLQRRYAFRKVVIAKRATI